MPVDPHAPLRLEEAERSDGLRILRQPPPANAASCAITYVGPAGWGFDPEGREGAARLAARIAVSATTRYDRRELARRLDRLGGAITPRCAPESSEITIGGPASEWRRLVDLLFDVVLRPRFHPEDIARAKRQLRERQLRQTSQPGDRADHELLRSIFPRGHPYAGSGLGTARSLARIRRSDLLRFHREHYSSGDALVVATVPARLAEIVRAVRAARTEFPRTDAPPLTVPESHEVRPAIREIPLPGRTQVEVRIGGRSIARSAPEYPAAYLANEILGGRPVLSRLFQVLREQAGLVYGAGSGLESMRFGGYWYAQAGTGAERWRQVVPQLSREIARLAETPVSGAELAMFRESALGEIALALDSTPESHELAVDLAYHRLPLDHWLRWPEQLRAVGPGAVRDAARLALDARRAVTVVAGPLAAA